MTIPTPFARRAALALPALLAASAAGAHPGHDSAPAMGLFEGLQHLLTQPDHVAMLLGAVVLAVAGARAWRARRAARRPSSNDRRR